MTSSARCPCGTGQIYALCCARLHSGEASAATAVELMRSRFSAFALSDATYLLNTWHRTTCPPVLHLDAHVRWTQLEIVRTVAGGMFDSVGQVEFRAHYREAGKYGALHELSSFVRDDGRWLYVDGIKPEK